MLSKQCDISISGIVLLKLLNGMMSTAAGAGLHDQKYPSSPAFQTTKQQHPCINLFPIIMLPYSVAILD